MNVEKVLTHLYKKARSNRFLNFEAYTSISDRIQGNWGGGNVIVELLALAEKGKFK